MSGSLATIAVSAVVSGVGVWALKTWREKKDLRLRWSVFPSMSMMTLHRDVADKLKITYDAAEVTKLTKRRFMLRNTGRRAIDAEKGNPLYFCVSGPVLDCSSSQTSRNCGALLDVAVNSKDKQQVDIQWKDYMNPKHEEYVDVLFDECDEKLSSLQLLGQRRETSISTRYVPGDYEQRHATRTRITSALTVGSAIIPAVGILASPAVGEVFEWYGVVVMSIGLCVTSVGVIVAFAKARIERRE